MKRIFPIIGLCAILLTGNIAFVQGATLSTAKSKTTQTRANYKANLIAIAHLQEKVRTNRAEILGQKASASVAYNKAKSHIKGLIKNKDSLTPSQLESIKESLNLIKQDKQSIAGTIGEIQKETLVLRTAKLEKNFDEFKSSLDNIIAVQNSRLEDLQRTISDINKAATL